MIIRMITRLFVIVFPLVLFGCSSNSVSPVAVHSERQSLLTGRDQLAGNWVVSAIGDREVSGYYAPRIAFGADDRVGGIAGCNRFLGSYQLGKSGALAVSKMKLTRRLCPEAVMLQEELFLNRLRDVETGELSPTGELLIYSGQYKLPIRLRQVKTSSEVSDAGRTVGG